MVGVAGKRWRRFVAPLVLVIVLTIGLIPVPSARAVSLDAVISQVYGGGGNSGATLTQDYVELSNRGAVAVDLAGWSVQYLPASASASSPWQVTPLSGAIQPSRAFLVAEAKGAGGTTELPTPDVTGSIPMSATGGTVALVTSAAPLTCKTAADCAADSRIRDLVGYGTATVVREGQPTANLSNTTAALRNSAASDTDNNAADFTVGPPNPRNSGGGDPPPPAPIDARIREIQGSSHSSPLSGKTVANVPGIVTATAANGFYIQDPAPDTNAATSEALFVFTSTAPAVRVGDAVVVGGLVTEFRPGGSTSANLTTTELTTPTVRITSSGNPLPPPTIIGTGGRVPPTTVIEDDAAGSVESSGTFDPATDGIDFYESLEGMLLQINNAVAVGPTNSFGEIPVLADNGVNASLRTPRGGIIIRPGDFNPERIILDDVITATPLVNVGDHFSTAVQGVLDYSFGNFKLLVTTALTGVASGLARESTTPAAPGQLTVATFNVENLDPGDSAAKFATLAAVIVANLQSPDILAIEEAQDSSGPTNDGVVDATQTFQTLIAAIAAAGGPTYDFRTINPVNNQDGGEPGGNIRVGFLFRTDRGVRFVDRPGGTATAAVAVVTGANGPELSFSPGRIDPTNAAFASSRKPLVGEFLYNGQTLFVIANHFNSKSGDQPLFGRFQPPTLSSETQRIQQAQVVNGFVQQILAINPLANIIAAGDFNDFQFSPALAVLKGAALFNMIDTLPENERYSYVFDGNSQTLDHILVSANLFTATSARHDVVHVNAEFADQASDHDPQVSFFTLRQRYPFSGFFQPVDAFPTLNTVKAGSAIPVKFSLGGDHGLSIFAAGYPKSQPISCDAGQPTDAIESTVTAGNSGLGYDASTGTYTYTWKTERNWAGSCRQLLVLLDDGTLHVATFRFAK